MDRFSSAEATLFGGAAKAIEPASQPKAPKDEPPGGRILRSLVEPPPPVIEEPPPVRRGRKPGSKNKPKLQSTPQGPSMPEVSAERPRRGRKPGSKNRPKSPVSTAFPSALSGGEYSAAAAMRDYGFTDDGSAREEPSAPRPVEPSPPPPDAIPDAEALPERAGRRRLRDRSTILKRYVLDLEPRPGQPGALRARRLARAAPR